MVSSVTAQGIEAHEVDAKYWKRNLVSAVCFIYLFKMWREMRDGEMMGRWGDWEMVRPQSYLFFSVGTILQCHPICS
jgi:hypothetical protein